MYYVRLVVLVLAFEDCLLLTDRLSAQVLEGSVPADWDSFGTASAWQLLIVESCRDQPGNL